MGIYSVDGYCYFRLDAAIEDAQEFANKIGKAVNVYNTADGSIEKTVFPI